MPASPPHTRILSLPVPEPVGAGKLDSFTTQQNSRRADLILDYHATVPHAIALLEYDGKLIERSRGCLQPRRIRFKGIERLEIRGLYDHLDRLPPDHPARTIGDLYSWRTGGERLAFYLLWGRSPERAELQFFAREVAREERGGESVPYEIERDWSSAPSMPAGLVPRPRQVHRRFGGDPVTIHLDGQTHQRRLFVGGLEIQPVHRPEVHAILNLGEQPSRWSAASQPPPADRWVNQGEGAQGMDAQAIREQAGWIIGHLRRGERVLVHCIAGMNRSVTVCCAVLILLEGLTAEAALERVRERHPWARPDGRHWLVLKWLARG